MNRKVDEDIKRLIWEEHAFRKNIFPELEPLIKDLIEKPEDHPNVETFRKAYFEYLKKKEHYKKISRYIAKGVLRSTSPLKDRLQLVFWYLCVLEAVNHTVVNILVIFINTTELNRKKVGGKNSICFDPKLQNAFSFEDLENQFISLGLKINFLRKSGLKKVASVIDTSFRNALVHFDFDVENDDIVLNGNKIMPLVMKNIQNLLRLSAVVSTCLEKLAIEKEFHRITFEC